MKRSKIVIFLVVIGVSIGPFQCSESKGSSSSSGSTRNYRVRTKSSGFRPSFSNNYTSFNTPEMTSDDYIHNGSYPSPTYSSSRAMPLAEEFDHDQALDDIGHHHHHHDNIPNDWSSQHLHSNHGHRNSLNSIMGSSSKYSSGSSNSNNYLSNALPSVAPRYSDEKLGIHSVGSALAGASANVAAALNPVYSSYPYNYYPHPLLESLYERAERERAARELLVAASSRITPNVIPNQAIMNAAASSLYGSAIPPLDLESYGDALASASGHHNHGWGWKGEYVSKVNTNAIGLLGLLGLLSLLSNVLYLLALTTTTVAGRRKKRSSEPNYSANEESDNEKRQRIFTEVLPFLTPVAHARNGILPVECTLHGICMTNRLIVKEYGLQGRSAGNRITSAVATLLEQMTGEKDGHKKIIEMAGLKGRNQNNCQKTYPLCKAMSTVGDHSIPFLIKMEELPQLLQKFQKLSAGHNYNHMRL